MTTFQPRFWFHGLIDNILGCSNWLIYCAFTNVFKINGENLLTLKFVQEDSTQVVLNRKSEEILTIRYDANGRPVQIVPRGLVDGLNITYDKQSRLILWSFGDMNVMKIYDNRTNHLVERRLSNRATYRYMYRNNNKVDNFSALWEYIWKTNSWLICWMSWVFYCINFDCLKLWFT